MKIRTWAFSIAVVLIAGGIAIAVASLGAGAPAGALLYAPAVNIVGLPAAIAMITLGIILGGVAGLKRLYKEYKISEKSKDYILLEKK